MPYRKKAIHVIIFSIITNLVLAVAKWFAGILGNSNALIADAIESTADIFSSILVLLGLKYSSRPPDKNHPYGHGRAETLMTFLIVAFLITSATVIAYKSILNMQIPHPAPKPFTLIVLGIVILWKELSFRFILSKSKETHSSSLKADAWHHRSDAITSVAAFIGISLALILGKGWEVADEWAALISSAFILYNSYLIFRPALSEIMDEHVYDEMDAMIRKISKNVEGVIDTEKCNIRKTGMRYHVDLHAIVNANISVKEGHDIAHRLKNRLLQELPQIADILIHVEPNE